MSKMFMKGPQGWSLQLANPEISWIRIDFQTRIQVELIEFVIETPFQLTIHGVIHSLDPGDRERLGPLLAIYPGSVIEVRVSLDGVLNLELSNASRIVVEPHPKYEAWSIVGPDGFLVVCRPGGGEPAIWNRPTTEHR